MVDAKIKGARVSRVWWCQGPIGVDGAKGGARSSLMVARKARVDGSKKRSGLVVPRAGQVRLGCGRPDFVCLAARTLRTMLTRCMCDGANETKTVAHISFHCLFRSTLARLLTSPASLMEAASARGQHAASTRSAHRRHAVGTRSARGRHAGGTRLVTGRRPHRAAVPAVSAQAARKPARKPARSWWTGGRSARGQHAVGTQSVHHQHAAQASTHLVMGDHVRPPSLLRITPRLCPPGPPS